MHCVQPGCGGSIADGYCDVCGLAADSPAARVVTASGRSAESGSPRSTRASSVTNRLGTVPLGSARSTTASRATKRLDRQRGVSRLGAGLTEIPSVPILDPRQALMDPAVVSEEKRFCSVCQSVVGRARDGSPGRTKGFCPKCRTPFDFEPKLTAGTMLGGQYEIMGCLAHGGMGWIYLARDRNVNDRWVVVKGLLNAGDPDAYRAAVAEKQFLAEVEHPIIVEIYNFVAGADGSSYIVMEYVGGQSLNNLLKSRMKAASGRFSPLPLDQAVAFMIEVLPAFSYLHGLGLLYCDFKPANVIQVGDGIKLIDLGGVRRIDDDASPIYGTVGFQAPEVAADGTSVPSDLYTIARTLAVLVFEFRGYQNQYVDSLPPPDEAPILAEHDSLYRLLQRGTALRPEDRFQTAEEMRVQLLGVLREIAAHDSKGDVTRSTPSSIFDAPTVASDRLEWYDLPRLGPDVDDPLHAWLQSVTTDDPVTRRQLLDGAPGSSVGLSIEIGYADLALGHCDAVDATARALLQADPWEWRAVWMQGLAALQTGRAGDAVGAFNTVYGQLPGELAPKLALALACEQSGDLDVAERTYAVCARSDAAYVAAAQFGLARVAAAGGRRGDALAALDRIPTTSRAYGDSRRKRALILAAADGAIHRLVDLDAAAHELEQATMDEAQRAQVRVQIYESALRQVLSAGSGSAGPDGDGTVGGVAASEVPLRQALERAYRAAATYQSDRRARVQLVDLANQVRTRTLT